MIYGPIGLKSLFSPKSFYPDKEVDPETGAIRPCMIIIGYIISIFYNNI